MDTNKTEKRMPIDNLNEIYKLADRLRTAAGSYVKHSGTWYLNIYIVEGIQKANW